MFRRPISDCLSCPLGRASTAQRCPWAPASRAAGAVLFRQGERAPHLVFIREGLVARGELEREGRQGSATVRGPASVLGFEALRDQPLGAQVVALTPVKMCVLDREAMRDWLGPPGPARVTLELALEELERLGAEHRWRHGSSLARVARFALAQVSAGSSGTFPLPKSLVARVIGIRAETLSRSIHELVERGLIDPKPPHPIQNRGGLEKIAGENDPAEGP